MDMKCAKTFRNFGLLFAIAINCTANCLCAQDEPTLVKPMCQAALRALQYTLKKSVEGAIATKTFIQKYAVPYTITGSQKVFCNYAIPYTIASYTHTKYFFQNYVIPSLVLLSKTGYNAVKTLYNSLKSKIKPIAHQNSVSNQIQQNVQISYANPTLIPHTNPQELNNSTIIDQNNMQNQTQTPSDEDRICCICMEFFQQNRVKLEPCGHNIFCKKCIADNLEHGRIVCPICNQKFANIIDYN